MKKVFPVYILLMIGLLSLVRCGVVYVGLDDVNPPDDSTINPEDTITVKFDDAPLMSRSIWGQCPSPIRG